MKISETIERDCCHDKDLKLYNGMVGSRLKGMNPKFCVHCGQVWVVDRQMDAAGSMESCRRAVSIFEEESE